jgi:replicative DNA helicase
LDLTTKAEGVFAMNKHESVLLQMQILGGVLLSPGVFLQIRQIGVDGDFTAVNKIVWTAMHVALNQRGSIDMITVSTALADMNELEAVGG